MSRKRIKFKYCKERVLLSDVLPYETPLNFTNRHFYDFLLENRIEFKNQELSWKKSSDALDKIIHLLFGLTENEKSLESESRYIGTKKTCFKKYILKNSPSLIPFGYKISHKQSEFRELTIPHPRSQIAVVGFYDAHKENILYSCSKSSFSIRKPVRISKFKFYKDKTHYQKLENNYSFTEEHGKEYENLKSFFAYKNYSNVYKFYESYKFHRCEKKYNFLFKLDISKCFDSIYTHSISWSLLGKDNVKENLKASNETFPGQFDRLMQNMNYAETNGIIIGPEFSRIFAEIILQFIDKKLESELLEKHKLKHKSDYEIFRYVDDYFIFCNEESDRDKIADCLRHALKEFKLYLNESKSVKYEKPIVTEISRAKQKITRLLKNRLRYKFDDKIEKEEGGDAEKEMKTEKEEKSLLKGEIFINSNKLITEFKTIMKECDVEYKDILNYSLAISENKCNEILRDYENVVKSYRSQKQITLAIIAILDFTFFIHAASPQVNTTIRLCRIIRILCSFLKSKSISTGNGNAQYLMDSESKHLIYKCIYDNVRFIVERYKIDEHAQIETLYLLIALSQLGKSYLLEEKILAQYFNIPQDQESGEYKSKARLNYFSYTVILFYMRNRKKYVKLKKFIEGEINNEFLKTPSSISKRAELVMLFFDAISCPYVSSDTKEKIMTSHGINESLQKSIINFRNKNGDKQLWFTTWHNFNFGKELDAKQSQEVY